MTLTRVTRICAFVAFLLTAPLAVATLGATAAAASCVGPSITASPTTLARGQQLTVTGQAWGTACNDTGLRPGEPALGEPATGIAVVVAQGDVRMALARGDASANYTFRVAVTVPATFRPGVARLTAQSETSAAVQPVELTITDAPARNTSEGEIVEFGASASATTGGPGDGAAARLSGTDSVDTLTHGVSSVVWWIVGVAGLLLIVFSVVWRRHEPGKERPSSGAGTNVERNG
jgi:hypothetical protein